MQVSGFSDSKWCKPLLGSCRACVSCVCILLRTPAAVCECHQWNRSIEFTVVRARCLSLGSIFDVKCFFKRPSLKVCTGHGEAALIASRCRFQKLCKCHTGSTCIIAIVSHRRLRRRCCLQVRWHAEGS